MGDKKPIPTREMPSTFQSAPNEKNTSLLSKAWQYFQAKAPKDTVDAAEVYRKKSKDLFPNEIYPELSKPYVSAVDKDSKFAKTMVINNSVANPRTSIKRYRYPWTKQLNTETTPRAAETPQVECDPGSTEDEGVFTVEVGWVLSLDFHSRFPLYVRPKDSNRRFMSNSGSLRAENKNKQEQFRSFPPSSGAEILTRIGRAVQSKWGVNSPRKS